MSMTAQNRVDIINKGKQVYKSEARPYTTHNSEQVPAYIVVYEYEGRCYSTVEFE